MLGDLPIEIEPEIATQYGVRAAVVVGLILQEPEGIDKSSILRSLPFISRPSLGSVLNRLLDGAVIFAHRANPFIVQQILKSKALSTTGYGRLTCSWCDCQTLVLSNHHFPVPAKEGGMDTVEICSNCHTEYHYLINQPIYRHSRYHHAD